MPQKAKRLDPKSYSSPGKSEITFSHCFVLQLTVAIKLRLLYPLSYPFLIWERIRTSDTSCSQRPFRNAVDLKSRRTAQAKTCSQKHRMQIHASPMRENGPSISNRRLPEDTTKKLLIYISILSLKTGRPFRRRGGGPPRSGVEVPARSLHSFTNKPSCIKTPPPRKKNLHKKSQTIHSNQYTQLHHRQKRKLLM